MPPAPALQDLLTFTSLRNRFVQYTGKETGVKLYRPVAGPVCRHAGFSFLFFCSSSALYNIFSWAIPS